MTCAEVIAEVDRNEPNQYDLYQKLKWLSTLDGKVLDEVIMTHRRAAHETMYNGGRCPLPPYNDAGCTLLIADPYANEIYCSYLQMMIAKENAERARYNDERAIYEAAYQQYCDWYTRTHRPLTGYGKKENRFCF